MNQEFVVSELAAHVGGEIVGEVNAKVFRVADLTAANTGHIAFVEDSKLFAAAANSKATCLIVPPDVDLKFSGTIIRVKQPKLAFAKIAALLHPLPLKRGHHPTAVVAKTAEIQAGTYLGAFVTIGERSFVGESTQIYDGSRIGNDVTIGKCCIIHPNVVLYDNVTIGNDVVLHAGVVIGADGFGYVRGDEGYIRFPQIGTVVIEDAVEIGAHACVDRAALGETRIGQGTKIDNLVQVGHNVTIGERVVIASQTGISGSTVIESDAVIGGQVGMGDHARVLSGAVIGSKAGVLPGKIVRAGVWWGVPVQPLEEYKRQNAYVKALPRLREEVRDLQQRLSQLEELMSDESKI